MSMICRFPFLLLCLLSVSQPALAQTTINADGTFTTDTAGTDGIAGSPGTAGAGAVQFGTAGLTVTLDANITGGTGGLGIGSLNGGGAGGFGFSAQNFNLSNATFAAGKTTSGGNGGNGATPGGGNGGPGGAGGTAIYSNGTNTTFNIQSTVQGGHGGNGGNASGVNKPGGLGAAGGAGVQINAAGGNITIGGSVTAGNGGNSGNSATANKRQGGNGGTGLLISTGSTTPSILIQSGGSVTGGNAGAPSPNGDGTALSGIAGNAVSLNGVVTDFNIQHGAVVQGGNSTDNTAGSGIVTGNFGTSGTFTNAGTIRGGATGGVAGSSTALNIRNTITTVSNTSTGVIGVSSGAGNGVAYSTSGFGTATFTNAGQILAGSGSALLLTSGTSIASLNNNGTISAQSGDGVLVQSATITDLINTGTISALTGSALMIDTGSTFDSTITNTGGTFTSANVGATSGTITFATDFAAKTLVGGTLSNTAGGNALFSNTAQSDAFILQNVAITGNLGGGAGVQNYTLNGTTTFAGNIDLGAGANLVTFDTDYTGNNSFGATGGTLDLVLTGNHAMTLNAMQAASNNIRNLSVGTTSRFRANQNFDGSGTITNNGSIYIPSGVTLTMNDMTASTGSSSWIFGFNPAGSIGKLILTGGGAVDFTNSVLSIDSTEPTGYIVNGQDFLIADGGAAANLGGAQGAYLSDTSAVLDFIAYRGDTAAVTESGADATQVYVEVQRQAVAEIILDQTNTSLAALIDTIGPGGGADIAYLQQVIQSASSAQEVDAILEQLKPNTSTSSVATIFSASSDVIKAMDTRVDFLRGHSAAADDFNTGVWIQGFGHVAEQGAQIGVSGYNARLAGLAIGADTGDILDGSILGAAVSIARGTIKSEATNNASADIDSYMVSVYGDRALDHDLLLSGSIGYGFSDNDTQRTVLGGAVTGNYSVHSYAAHTALNKTFFIPGGPALSPGLTMDYHHFSVEDYTERGPLALRVQGQNTDILEVGLGTDARWSFPQDSGAKIEPFIGFNWRYNVLDRPSETRAGFVTAPSSGTFTSNYADNGAATIGFNGGVDFFSESNWQLSASYGVQRKEDYTAHQGQVRAWLRF